MLNKWTHILTGREREVDRAAVIANDLYEYDGDDDVVCRKRTNSFKAI